MCLKIISETRDEEEFAQNQNQQARTQVQKDEDKKHAYRYDMSIRCAFIKLIITLYIDQKLTKITAPKKIWVWSEIHDSSNFYPLEDSMREFRKIERFLRDYIDLKTAKAINYSNAINIVSGKMPKSALAGRTDNTQHNP